MNTQAAVFLDRDGVINYDPGYVYQKKDFQFIPGIFDACRKFIQLGYKIIIITNQSGIARGFYSEDDFKQLTQWMLHQFDEQDVSITDVYYCPHHNDYGKGSYKIACDCRKPKPGMIKQAEKEHHLDLSQSILIGDKPSDIKAGQAAGVAKNYLVKTGKPISAECSNIADAIYDDLMTLSENI
jgi:D-glycero-D-manno-heptose 1,7-bisphosphate phosphatase